MLSPADRIRRSVRHGIACNRVPGFHFTGHFLDLSHDPVAPDGTRISMRAGPHCAEADGGLNAGALACFADLSVAAAMRAGHDPAMRLATVSLNLNFTGAPATGRLETAVTPQGYLSGTVGRQGIGSLSVTADGTPVCFGTAAFMALDPPKGVTLHPRELRREGDPAPEPVPADGMTAEELAVMRKAEDALAASGDGRAFIRRFWGYDTEPREGGAAATLRNGPHVANRVGHLQGGIAMGLGMATAEAALPAGWMTSAATAWFISPCEGRTIRAASRVLHQGRLTCVIETRITGRNRRRALELVTTHARRMD
jgi:acyl-coenzyme A thioesterase PaaI-like protein